MKTSTTKFLWRFCFADAKKEVIIQCVSAPMHFVYTDTLVRQNIIQRTDSFYKPFKILFEVRSFYACQTLFWEFIHVLMMVLAQMQGKKFIISNGLFRFQFIPYHFKFFKFSPINCNKSIFYLWFIYLIEFIIFMYVHLNNFSLNFARSWSRIKLRCTRYSTNPKMLQALIKQKILHVVVWWKWAATLPCQL